MNETAAPESDSPQAPAFRPTPERDMHWVFFGPHGLRAGWSMLVFVFVLVALGYGVSAIVGHFWHPHFKAGMPMPPAMGIINEGVQLAVVAIATGIMSLIERKPVFFYGYQGQARGLRFFSGLFWGFAAISALVLVLDKLGYLSIDGRALSGSSILRYGLLWGFGFLLVGFFEESTLRGYLQFTFLRGVGFWWGAIGLSLLFGFGHGHNPGESPVGLFAAGAIGLVFCLSLWYTGSLWWAVGFHAAWDWGESYFYGTADSGLVAQGHLFQEHPIGKLLWSGGATGPEGSILVLPLLVLAALAMFLWWGLRTQSPFAGSAWRPQKAKAATEVAARLP
jgi:uncharacterized protein